MLVGTRAKSRSATDDVCFFDLSMWLDCGTSSVWGLGFPKQQQRQNRCALDCETERRVQTAFRRVDADDDADDLTQLALALMEWK